jgi:hypothetical protein
MSPNARPTAAAPGFNPPTSTGIIPIFRDANGNVNIEYTLTEPAQVQLILISSSMQEMARLEYNNQTPGPYQKSLDLSKAPSGTYSLVVKANGKLTRNYSLKIP